MLTIRVGNRSNLGRISAKRAKALLNAELKTKKEANRNVGRKVLTQMVRDASKGANVPQKAIRGKKITGKANRWSRAGLFSRPPSSPRDDVLIRFNMSPIPFRKIGKMKQLKRGGVKAGKHYAKDAFIGKVRKGRSFRPKYDAPPSTNDDFSFQRVYSSRYPLSQTSVEIETAVKKATPSKSAVRRQALKEVVRIRKKRGIKL